jgi:nucleotide-binding universal stress UspA family protein
MKHIIVAIDFSVASACAFREAARLAAANDATLHAIHVIDSKNLDDVQRQLSALGTDVRGEFIREANAQWLKFIGDHPAHNIGLDIEVGQRLQTVLLRAAGADADLLVLGTHGANGPDVGTGPLALACARQAQSPVLLVRPPASGRFNRIVACVDFFESSSEVLRTAASIAAGDRARLAVVLVFSSPWNHLDFRLPACDSVDEYAARYRSTIEARLGDFCAKYVPADLSYERHAIDHSSPGVGCAAFGREFNADLIVVGTHGDYQPHSFSIGSTGERLLQEAPCSIWVTRSSQAPKTSA